MLLLSLIFEYYSNCFILNGLNGKHASCEKVLCDKRKTSVESVIVDVRENKRNIDFV